MTVVLAQFGALADKSANLHIIKTFAKQAADTGASLLFLPEYSMFYAKANRVLLNPQAAEPLDGPFVRALGRIAREHHLWLAAGLYEQTDDLPYNTIVVLDDAGVLRGFHRKQMLYDAFGYRESDECRAGDTPFAPIETPIGRLGILTCYELRFPALAAAQCARGAQTLLVPAGWVVGAHKTLHWCTLLAARAIENRTTVLGVNQWRDGLFLGHTAAFSRNGECIASLETGEGLLSVSLD